MERRCFQVLKIQSNIESTKLFNHKCDELQTQNHLELSAYDIKSLDLVFELCKFTQLFMISETQSCASFVLKTKTGLSAVKRGPLRSPLHVWQRIICICRVKVALRIQNHLVEKTKQPL